MVEESYSMTGSSYSNRPLRRRRQGNMLAMVVAILFVLVVLILALHTSQSKAVRNVTQGEAELEYRQGYEFAVAKLLAQEQPLPGWVSVEGETEILSDKNLGLDYSKTLFQQEGLPSLDPREKPHPPGFNTYKVTPDTSDAALQVFQGKFQWLVTQSSGGYTAYAPKGKITLESAVGWQNPVIDEDKESATAFSAVPVLLASQSDLTVNDLKYGMAYSVEGPLEIKGEGAIGFQARPPLRAYETQLVASLDALKSTMASRTSSENKTSLIKGDALATAASMASMIFGGGGTPSITLQQAMQVPFPMIPGFSATVPGVFYEFWFHMPHPPDFSSFERPGGRDATADANEAKRLKEAMDKKKAEIAAVEKQIQQATTDSKRDELKSKKTKLEGELQDLEDQAKELQEAIEKEGKENEKAINNKINSGSADEPETRLEDKDIPKTGKKGWAYGAIWKGFFNLLKSTITGDAEGIASSVVNFVRIVHFGNKTNVPDFRFDNGFYAKATLNVPSGRSFRYDGNLELEGDLWLQKGSAAYIGGDLKLNNPNEGSNNPFLPAGKLVLEEGATLVVEGDIELAGQQRYGSLWVCSPLGDVKPIGTAILSSGQVTIPHGSFTATGLEDAARWIGSKEGALKGLVDVLTPLFNDVAPNLAKIAGPFHTRQPFFASYAATFQLTIVPTPVGPIPIPSPIPLPRKNILVPIFRGFTYVYTPTLNATLGENLYTQADWWGFGQGVVPVLVKLNPEKMVQGLGGVNLGGLNLKNISWEGKLEGLVDQVLEGAMEFVVTEVVKAVMKELAKAAIPGGGAAGFVLDAITDALDLKSDFLSDMQEALIDATLGPIITELERWMDDLKDQVRTGLAEGYLREVNGPLIYADSITVGESNPVLMAGMLVARTNITVDAQTFVGSMICLEGDIQAKKVLYSPHFTRASLYLPRASESSWILRTADWRYGAQANSNSATGISTGVNMVRVEGWNR